MSDKEQRTRAWFLKRSFCGIEEVFCAGGLFVSILFLSISIRDAVAQTTALGRWTWVGGSDVVQRPGVYGTLQTPSAGNVPGARQSAMGWTDKSSNLWLFGGSGDDASGTNGYLNDLWRFNSSTGEWTWMSGSSTVPESCGVNSTCGQSGIYGTLQTPASGNVPGARYLAATRTDASGDLWLFGGFGYDSAATFGMLNDLWEFKPATNQWTWISGGSTITGGEGAPGVYGTQGQAAATNTPGSRAEAISWTDGNGNFWLFGGDGGINGKFNDLWKFNPSTDEWPG
jgi:N-acetylneuraminic acid mutarotase